MCFAGHPVLTGVLKNCQNVFQCYISGNIKATKMVLILLERARSSHLFEIQNSLGVCTLAEICVKLNFENCLVV